MKSTFFCTLILTLALVSGCSWLGFGSKDERSAQELASDGVDAYTDGDYKAAIQAFEKLKDWYPFSKYTILAELKIADAYYYRKEYAEAIFAYQEFENLHPRNEAVPYVGYQIGLCYFEQIETVDRDQSQTRDALNAFQNLISRFPNSPYANLSIQHIKQCLANLAGHDFYVGQFYYKSRHYKAALDRFRSVITSYPDVGNIHYQALDYIAQCEQLLARQTNEDAPAIDSP